MWFLFGLLVNVKSNLKIILTERINETFLSVAWSFSCGGNFRWKHGCNQLLN